MLMMEIATSAVRADNVLTLSNLFVRLKRDLKGTTNIIQYKIALKKSLSTSQGGLKF